MAYSSVRVQFEIGHEASVRTKKTPEGFTHDWEVFVRGADNTDIQCFVDKVVFYLHETFPKPKRVIKEPPYVVKESGYAGFVLPIDVYLKNKEEPKKINFQYDLTLQSSGPPISRVLREPRLFQNPSEDFRRKLIRGGGVGVDTPSETSAEDLKSVSSISQSKSKPVDSPAKKHKPDHPLNHSFAELFGTPIRRIPETKKLPELSKKIDDKKKLSKPYKEEKEIMKEKYLERDKSKEKSKRPTSPSLPPPPAPQVKTKDEYKKHEEKEKKKEEEKRKKKEVKDKKEKAKESDRQLEKELRKDKKESRDGDYSKKLNSKPPDLKPNYEKHNSDCLEKEKERLEKDRHKHRHKKKEKEKTRDKEKHRKDKEKDLREKEKEKTGKKKYEGTREKEEKKKKSKSPSPLQVKKGPLNALLDELGSSDSASPLSEDESIPPVKSLLKPSAKIVPEIKSHALASVMVKSKSTTLNDSPVKLGKVSLNKNKKEKSSSNKSKKSDKDPEKKKEKEEHRARSLSSERAEREEEEEGGGGGEEEEEEVEEVEDEEEKEEPEEEEEEEEEKDRTNKEERTDRDRLTEDKARPKDKENRKRKREKSEEKQTKSKKNESTQSGAVEMSDRGTAEELRRSDKFTKEYVAQLRDLQHRIMTLEDNAELQKVVKVIAETGQYEVTKKTFDFDLCALDMETVKRLQEFFAPT